MSYKLHTGLNKNGGNWYALSVEINDYKSALIFITKIEYDYLVALTEKGK